MKKFLAVLKFELGQKLKEKSFIISTIITLLIVFGLTFVSRFVMKDDKIWENPEKIKENLAENQEKTKIAVKFADNLDPSVRKAIEKEFEIKEVKNSDEIIKELEADNVEYGYEIISPLEVKEYVKGTSFMNFSTGKIGKILEDNYKYNIGLKSKGINPNDVREIENSKAVVSSTNIGKDGFSGYIISYITLFIIYFMVLMNGQVIATNVAKEKDSRTMELLVTNVKPKYLIWGKVLMGVIISFITVVGIMASAGIGILINIKLTPMFGEILRDFFVGFNITQIIIPLIFLFIGVTMYYFMFAGFASMVSRLDELNQSLTPVTLIFVAAFMIPMTFMSNPESSILRIASLVPFISPLAMIARFTMSDVPLLELGLSLLILIVTTVLVALFAIKLYRRGSLNYGKKLTLKSLFKK